MHLQVGLLKWGVNIDYSLLLMLDPSHISDGWRNTRCTVSYRFICSKNAFSCWCPCWTFGCSHNDIVLISVFSARMGFCILVLWCCSLRWCLRDKLFSKNYWIKDEENRHVWNDFFFSILWHSVCVMNGNYLFMFYWIKIPVVFQHAKNISLEVHIKIG